jgi:hypothetical protein
LIAGYPSSRHKKAMSGNTFTAATYNLLAHELDAAAYGEIGLARETTLAVASDKKDVWTTEGRRTAPNFNGMSGGGVWRLPTSGSAPLSAVTLAGIIIEHHQRHRIRHLVATRPSTILYFLAKRDQTLQSALAQIGVRVA